MKLLLIATDIPDSRTIRELGEGGGEDVEVYVVAPALQESALRFWLSDADDAIARARTTQEAAISKLHEAGVPATGDVGEGDPLQAAADALAVFPADRVLILTHENDERSYLEGELDEARERLSVPVEVQRVARTSS